MSGTTNKPTSSEALENRDVVQGLITAWNNTQSQAVEWGGWIFRDDSITGARKYGIKLKTDRQESAIILTLPRDIAALADVGKVIVADFHCHPGDNNASGRPSDADISGAVALSYGRIVFTYDRNRVYNIRALPAPTPDGFPDGAVMWMVR